MQWILFARPSKRCNRTQSEGMLIEPSHLPLANGRKYWAYPNARLVERTIAGRNPMWTSNYFTPVLLVLLAIVSLSPSAQAVDINGAWASDSSVCSKVFVKINNKISITPDAELYGGGLIIEGNRATGTFQNCNIKSMKDDGANVHLIAACSTGVMVSDLEITVKVIGGNQITVSPAGPVSIETSYVRCQL